MKSISKTIEKIKKNPTDKNKNELVDLLLEVTNLDVLDSIAQYAEEQWVHYDNGLHLKKLYAKTYLAVDVIKLAKRCRCFCYRIDLADYSPKAIEDYMELCTDYKEKSPNSDYYAAFSIAATMTEEDAVFSELLDEENFIYDWLLKVEREDY